MGDSLRARESDASPARPSDRPSKQARYRARAWRPARLLPALLAVAVGLAHLILFEARGSAGLVRGDEGTFLAMTESAAFDRDLVFDTRDRERLEEAAEKGRQAVILQRAGDRVAYSKPVLYPILAAPWFFVAGPSGLILFHIVAAAAAVLLAAGCLRRQGAQAAGLWVVTLAGTSVFCGYLVWTMSDSLQASLVLAGLALALAQLRGTGEDGTDRGPVDRLLEHRWAPVAGVVLLTLAGAMRFPNFALAAIPVLAYLLAGRWRRALLLGAVVALVAGLGLGLNRAATGAWVPYKTVRATFNPASGYPAGEGAERALRQFSEDVALARQRVGLVPEFELATNGVVGLYFLAGRHTGLLTYFPASLVLLLWAFRRPDRLAWAGLAGVLALAVFYLLWMPENYFGGGTFLGNRYFLTGAMALVFVPRRLPGMRVLVGVWLVAVVVFASALVSARRTAATEPSSQNHAYAGVFRWLPYETTARNLDGRRDVYWTNEFFRFVDPYSQLSPSGFRIRAGDPAAELVHASSREDGVVRYLARVDSAAAEVSYWTPGAAPVRVSTQAGEGGGWALLEIPVDPVWRRHRYWFRSPERTWTRIYRFSVSDLGGGDGGEAGAADFHYLGPLRLVPKFFSGVAWSPDAAIGEVPPLAGAAAGGITLPVGVRNTGLRFWSSADMVPTLLGYRLYRLPRRDGDKPVGARLQRFPGRVVRGQDLVSDLVVRLPDKPGRYQLVLDLNLAGTVWFESWNGEPLWQGEVTVHNS